MLVSQHVTWVHLKAVAFHGRRGGGRVWVSAGLAPCLAHSPGARPLATGMDQGSVAGGGEGEGIGLWELKLV